MNIQNILQTWSDPVSWWDVTTEGDRMGRTTVKLGRFYGHCAEIAFSINSSSGYSLNFRKVKEQPTPTTRQPYKSVCARTNISFSSDSNTWFEKSLRMDRIVESWLNYYDVSVMTRARLSPWANLSSIVVLPCNFFAAFTIKLQYRLDFV
jgi:hypothetical protein